MKPPTHLLYRFLPHALSLLCTAAVMYGLLAVLSEITAKNEPNNIPPARAVLRAIYDIVAQADPASPFTRRSIAITFERSMVVLLASTFLGGVIGFVFAKVKIALFVLGPTCDLVRSIPATFLIPFFMCFWSVAHGNMPVGLALVPCTLIASVCIADGVRSVTTERIHAVSLLLGRNSRYTILRILWLPSILPYLVTALRLNASYGIVLIAALEYQTIGSSRRGLGLELNDAVSASSRFPATVFAAVLLFGIVGLFLNKLLELLENRLMSWRRQAR